MAREDPRDAVLARAVFARQPDDHEWNAPQLSPDLAVDLQGYAVAGRAFHHLAHDGLRARRLILGSLEDDLVVDLQQDPRGEVLLLQPVVQPHHGDLHDVRRGPLDRGVHGHPLAPPSSPSCSGCVMARILRRRPKRVCTNPVSSAPRMVSLMNLSTPWKRWKYVVMKRSASARGIFRLPGKPERGDAVDDAEVDRLAHAPLLRGDLAFLDAEDERRSLAVDVLALAESLQEDGVLGKGGEDRELDLRVVGADETHAGCGHEGGTDAPSLLLADGDVLEIGILAGEPPVAAPVCT